MMSSADSVAPPDVVQPAGDAKTPAVTARRSFVRDRKGGLFLALRIAVSAGALAYLFHKAGFKQIGHAIASASPAWLGLGYGLGVVAIFVTVSQWHGLLNANGVPRSYLRCLHLEIACDLFDATLPTAIGGDVVRAVLVAESPAERVPSASSVVLRRLCNFPGMLGILAISLVASEGFSHVGRIRPVSIAVLAGGIGAIAVAMSPIMGTLARWRLMQLGPGKMLAKLLENLHDFRGQRRDLLVASLRGFILWSVYSLAQWSFMRAVGIHVPLVYGALVVTTTNLITILPISLGGYGVREGAFTAFLAFPHVASTGQAVSVGFFITAQVAIMGVIGAPFYLGLRRQKVTQSGNLVDASGRRPAQVGAAPTSAVPRDTAGAMAIPETD